jgi:hypothetical protein
MSQKTESKSKKNEQSTPSMSSITPEQFDVTKIKVPVIREAVVAKGQKESLQMNAWLEYNYPKKKGKNDSFKVDGTGEKLVILTGPIKLSKGGLATIDGNYRKDENSCQNISLPLLDDDVGGVELRDKVLMQLDNYFDKKINQEKNKDFVMKMSTDGKSPEAIKLLKFTKCVKTYVPGGKDDDSDETGVPIEGSFKRFKAKLNTKFVKDADLTKERELTTRVFTNDDDGNVQQEDVTCMEDMRKFVTWNSVVRVAIEFTKLWVNRNAKDKVRECSISAKILQIYVVEKGKSTMKHELSFVFGGAAAPTKHSSDESDKKSESGSGSDSESESEEKTPVKAASKKNNTNKDSDDESEKNSDDEHESPKATKSAKSTKTTGKTQKQAESEEDSEEDSEVTESESEEESTPPAKTTTTGKGTNKQKKKINMS